MKHLALGLTAAAGLLAVHSEAQNMYDTVNTASPLYYYAGPGNNVSGDNYLPPDEPAGWTLIDLEYIVVCTATDTYTLTVNLYDVVNSGPPPVGPAFSNLAFTTSGSVRLSPGAYLLTVPGIYIQLPNPPGGNGLGVEFLFDKAPNLSVAYVDAASIAPGSGWSNGFFVDYLNVSGTLENNEFVNFTGWSNGNVAFSLAGTTPSPRLPGPTPMVRTSQFIVKKLPIEAKPIRPSRLKAPSVSDAIPPYMLKSG